MYKIAIMLKKIEYHGLLVQCSGIYMPTPETIKISPYRYLLKQDDKKKTVAEMEEILQEMVSHKLCIEIEGSYLREKIMFLIENIVYFTHHSKGSVVHLCKNKAKRYEDGKIIVPYSFSELSCFLGDADFASPHNSYLVNLRYISDFDIKKEILIADGCKIYMSRGRKNDFFRKLPKYSQRKYRENRNGL